MVLYGSISFIAGLIFGSFANVCIARLPRGGSIVTPRSYCPKCNTPVKWFDNLPLISYVLLKAKCRACNEKISIQYPLVEFFTGVAFLALALHFEGSILLPVYLVFTLALIIITGIDYFHQIIPDSLSLGILVMGLCFCPFNQALGAGLKVRLINSLGGVIAGGGGLFLVGFIGEKIMRREAMGGGDVKLLAGIGAVLGWAKVFSVLFTASLIGSAFGLALIFSKKIERTGYIPFGPFLAFAAYLNLFLPNIMGFLNILAK